MDNLAGHFDADQFTAGIERPTLTTGGVTYVGRILSAVEFLPYEIRMRAVVAGDVSGPELAGLIMDYCNVVFPLPWWKFWKPSVGRLVLNMAPLTMMEAVKSFLVCQAKASGEMNETPAPGPQEGTVLHEEPLPATS